MVLTVHFDLPANYEESITSNKLTFSLNHAKGSPKHLQPLQGMSTEIWRLLGQPQITGHGETWPFNHVTPIIRPFSVPFLTLPLTSQVSCIIPGKWVVLHKYQEGSWGGGTIY